MPLSLEIELVVFLFLKDVSGDFKANHRIKLTGQP